MSKANSNQFAKNCVRWEQFLDEVTVGDGDLKLLLQMWFGYCLSVDTSQQKFLLVVGDGANGKSVLFSILAELLGDANVSHIPLELFGKEFLCVCRN